MCCLIASQVNTIHYTVTGDVTASGPATFTGGIENTWLGNFNACSNPEGITLRCDSSTGNSFVITIGGSVVGAVAVQSVTCSPFQIVATGTIGPGGTCATPKNITVTFTL